MSEPSLASRELLAAINANAIEVQNSTGAAILASTPLVYISGIAADGTPLITKADADAGSGTFATHAIVSDIADGERGWAFKRTILNLQNTATLNVSDPLYLSTTPGTITSVRPTGIALIQIVGRVMVVSATVGVVMIDLQAAGGGQGAVVIEQVRSQTVTGAGANTNMPVTGIKTTDRLISVVGFVGAGSAVTDLNDQTANCSITSDGNVQCTNSLSASGKVRIVWAKRSN